MLSLSRRAVQWCFSFAVGATLVLPFTGPASAQTLWYNGNLFGQGSLRNQVNSAGVGARVFDDFIVPDGQGWNVTSAWSNDWFFSSFFFGSPRVTQADWSIRTGMSGGTGGTIVASGLSPIQFSKTGRIPNFLYEEWTVRVLNMKVFLPSGIYWLNVTPVYGGDAYVSRTTGTGAIGQPRGNDANSLFDWPTNATNFTTTGQDWSLGVGGNAVPEPGMFALLGSMSVPGFLLFRRRRA